MKHRAQPEVGAGAHKTPCPRTSATPQQAAGEPGAHAGAAQAPRHALRARSQVLAATEQNLGVPSDLLNGDRSPPSPLAPGTAEAVSTSSPASQNHEETFCVRLLGIAAQPGPD